MVSAVTEAGMAEATKADEGAGSEQAAGAAGSDGIKGTAGDAGAAGVLQKAAGGEEAAGAYALSEQRIAADSGAEPLLDSSGILVQDDMPENNADAPGGARITAEKKRRSLEQRQAFWHSLPNWTPRRRNAGVHPPTTVPTP